MPVSVVHLVDVDAQAKPLEDELVALGRRDGERLAQLLGARGRSAALSSSRERSAFRNASLKVRPMAMASPTLFMCVVSSRSASGNFSNAQRGILTTT